jgi:nucleotide-binding universal stress UspA family protein
MKAFTRIMVATDFTPASKPAFRRALELARGNGAELIVTHAYAPPNLAQAEAVAPGVYEEWETKVRTDTERQLEGLVEDARQAGTNARAVAVSGEPEEAITDAARNHGADLLVMGTRGRKGVARFFLGSVASRVISTAPCPVMTVRAD